MTGESAASRRWIVRHANKDYPADDFSTLRDWFAANRVPPGSQIFDPEESKWLQPEALVPRLVEDFQATTTVGIDGHRVTRCIDIESVEIVIGTAPISEFAGGVADFFGARSTGFERKLQAAKRAAIQKLKFVALQRGADAVIGVDLDYTEFAGNRIGVVANGTLVALEKVCGEAGEGRK